MNNESKIILGLLGAAAAGAAIGVLIAPEKGSELRKRIKSKTSSFWNEFTEILTDVKSTVADTFEREAKSAVNETFPPHRNN